MTVIGNSARFAIEFVLDEQYAGVWLNGGIAVWIGGRRYGDLAREVSLRDVLFELDRRSYDRGHRTNPRFDALTGEAVFRLIDGALYSGLTPQLEEVANDEMWARHELVSGATLGWKVFVVERGSSARIIHGDSVFAGELPVEPGECDAVTGAVRDQLQTLLRAEGQE